MFYYKYKYKNIVINNTRLLLEWILVTRFFIPTLAILVWIL